MGMKNCVICGEPAIMWTGHIHTSSGTISAGHCQKHYYSNGTGQIAGCDSPNPTSCYGRRNLEDTELTEPLSDHYLATVNGKLQMISRNEYFKTDEANVGRKKRGLFDFLFR